MTLIDDCRANAHKVVDGDLAVFMAQNGNRMIVDTKRDGERCWLVKGDSRLSYPLNGMYAFNKHNSVYWEQTHHDLFNQYRNFGKDFIIEGELCSKNGQLYSYLSNRNDGKDLVFYPFDLLEYNGVNMRNSVLEYRLNVLQLRLAEIGMNNMNYYQDSSEADIRSRVDYLISEGHEGAVIKPILQDYNSGSWLRIKRQTTIDAVILGIKKKEKYLLDNLARSFRLGLRTDSYKSYAKPEFKWIGDVGSGLELYEKAALTELLEATKEAEDKEYIYTEPRFVVEITADSRSQDNHLISPRIKRIRTDKAPSSCLIDQLNQLPIRN
jgi:ATP-dependent DNA ligase